MIHWRSNYYEYHEKFTRSQSTINCLRKMRIFARTEDKDELLSDEQYGYPKAESEKWVSCIRVLDPKSATTTCLLELQDNEAAFRMCSVDFHDKEYGTLLAVGTAKSLQFWPKRSLACGYIHIYRYVDDGKSLELLHKTQVEGVPLALCQFQGRLLAGIGPVLRLYDLGKKRLLRKCENKLFPNTIMSIHTYRDRIYVGDIQESFHYCKYRRDENQLYIFADDVVPRWLTASYHVDFDTMAGADKFGNIYFVRLPQDVSDEIEEDPTGGKIKWEQGKLNGAPNKVEEIVQFHVGDVITCLHKASLIPGGGVYYVWYSDGKFRGLTCIHIARQRRFLFSPGDAYEAGKATSMWKRPHGL